MKPFRAGEAVVTAGKARFTVITPNLVRLEYSDASSFIDDASLFAVGRSARFRDFKLKYGEGTLEIDTGAIILRYSPDGKPFYTGNLKAEIRGAGKDTEWRPGMRNRHNLGGTVTCLGGVRGPVDLGEGLLSRDGWYLLDDSRRPLLTKDWVRERPREAGTDWYLFGYGLDFRNALKSLAAIAGPIPLPRKYVLGSWYSRNHVYSSAEFRRIVQEYSENGFPIDVLVLDMGWHRKGWTGWSWNREALPDAEELLRWLHLKGLAVTLNSHPQDGVGPHEDMYRQFMKDLGLDWRAHPPVPLDISSKRYTDALFRRAHAPHEKTGVDFWWLDWCVVPDKWPEDGNWDGVKWIAPAQRTPGMPELENLIWLNRCYFRHTGKDGKRGLSFSRWGGWGDHRHPIHFSGDAHTGFPMLSFEVPFTSTAGNVGCFFWSHDIGGYMGGRNDEAFTRWCQFGLSTTAMRCHSSGDPDRRPWLYPEWATRSMKKSFLLRSKLMPYVYSSVRQSCVETFPLNRAMYHENPAMEKAYQNPQQYLFGDAFLAAPVTVPGEGPGLVSGQAVWFPEGTWFNVFTGEKYRGESEILASADIDETPLYARGGIPIPMAIESERMTASPLDPLIVRCYPGPVGRKGGFTLYEDDGVSGDYLKGRFMTTELEYSRGKKSARVTIFPARGTYKGAIEERAFVVEFPCTGEGRRAKLDGKPVAVDYDPLEFANRIRIPSRPVSKGAVVSIELPQANFELIRRRAMERRIISLTGREPQEIDFREMVSAAAAADTKTAENILALAGAGFHSKNEGIYGYQGSTVSKFYSPAGLFDGNSFSLAVESETSGGSKTIAERKYRGGATVTLDAVAFPRLKLPSSKTGPIRFRAEFSICGRSFSLARAAS